MNFMNSFVNDFNTVLVIAFGVMLGNFLTAIVGFMLAAVFGLTGLAVS